MLLNRTCEGQGSCDLHTTATETGESTVSMYDLIYNCKTSKSISSETEESHVVSGAEC